MCPNSHVTKQGGQVCDVMIVQESESVVQAKSGAGGACSSADIKVSMPPTSSPSLTHAASSSSSSLACRIFCTLVVCLVVCVFLCVYVCVRVSE